MVQHTQEAHTYATIAEAIRFVRNRVYEQPSLEEVASHVGLSPHHLQRVFSQWAGISPKRFLQFLTKEHAKALLRDSRDVLTTSLAAGLSGPSRLHDLMVSCEALTPGEVGALGQGMRIQFGFASTPFGDLIAGVTHRGVCHLRFVEPGAGDAAEAELRGDWPRAEFQRSDETAQMLARRMAALSGAPNPLTVLVRGTNFQVKVWEALLRIPPGCVASYGDVARTVGSPRAVRAVGTALSHNPVAVLIPCHRVIREQGDIGGYRWGEDRKRALLVWEGAQRNPLEPVLPPRAAPPSVRMAHHGV